MTRNSFASFLFPVVLAAFGTATAQPPAFPALPAHETSFGDLTRTQQGDLRQKIGRVQTFALTYASQPNTGNEILTALRLLMDPAVKMYLLPEQNLLVMEATPDELALAGKLIAEWDRPQKVYRLTYTLTERDAGKVIGVQHVAFDVVSGLRTTFKNGSKVPVVTGSYKTDTSAAETQFTYLDLGLSFDATLAPSGDGAILKSLVEQSEVAGAKPQDGVDEPIIRQTKIEGSAALMPGKTVNLGSLDRIDSTRHLDVEVVMEPLK